jgi:hypothetical protein
MLFDLQTLHLASGDNSVVVDILGEMSPRTQSMTQFGTRIAGFGRRRYEVREIHQFKLS